MRAEGPLFFVVAGEPSGDVLGGRLMTALSARTEGRARFAGVGGERMMEAGLIPLFPMAELSVMGLGAVLERLPTLVRRLHQTVDDVNRLRPDAAITIDSPGFNFRLARRLATSGIPRIHYVAPTVWAWRPGRARAVARFLDHLLLLFPFEKPYFDAVGLPATYVGHPVIEEPIGPTDGAAFLRAHDFDEAAVPVTALPGSRPDEVRRLLPVFGAALGLLARRRPGLCALVPTVAGVAGQVAEGVARWPVPTRVVTGAASRYAAYAASRAALAASGSVTLELAAAALPMVVAYRTGGLTALVARRLVRTPWVGLVNILAGEGAVPELLQERCTPSALADALEPLLDDGAARRAQTSVMGRVMARLREVSESPSDAAARAVLDVVRARRAP